MYFTEGLPSKVNPAEDIRRRYSRIVFRDSPVSRTVCLILRPRCWSSIIVLIWCIRIDFAMSVKGLKSPKRQCFLHQIQPLLGGSDN